MTSEERQMLRRAAEDAMHVTQEQAHARSVRENRWVLQTSNSFRRIGCHGDGDVLCGTNQRDGHPDLLASPAVLDYVIAAQPSVVLKLLDAMEALEHKLIINEGLRVLKDMKGRQR